MGCLRTRNVSRGRARPRPRWCSLLLAALLLPAAPAFGQAPTDAAAVSGDAASAPARSKEEEAKEYFGKGNELFLAGKYPEAGLQYEKTLALMPGLANPHKNLARCYLAMKQENMYPDAAFHLVRYRQLKPQEQDRDVAADLRIVLAALGLPGKAGEELGEVGGLLEQQATAAAEEEKWALAVIRFQQLRDLFPERSDLVKLLAESLLGALRCDDAQSAYQAYLLVHPEERDGLDLDSMISECREEARQKGAETGVPGKLTVIANVTGAFVLVNGKRMGTTPLDAPIRLPAGDHQLALFKEGYETLSRKVSVSAGKSTQVELSLIKFASEPAVGSMATGGVATVGVQAPAPGPAGPPRLLLQPSLGLITGLGGTGGPSFDPSFRVQVGYLLRDDLSLDLELGLHLGTIGLDSYPPFADGEIAFRVIPLLVGATYRHPLGPVELQGGAALGLLFTNSTVRGDAGPEVAVGDAVIGVRLQAGAAYPLGPGSLLGTVGYLAHPLNTVAFTYQGDDLADDVVFGGLGVHLGYGLGF